MTLIEQRVRKSNIIEVFGENTSRELLGLFQPMLEDKDVVASIKLAKTASLWKVVNDSSAFDIFIEEFQEDNFTPDKSRLTWLGEDLVMVLGMAACKHMRGCDVEYIVSNNTILIERMTDDPIILQKIVDWVVKMLTKKEDGNKW